MFDAPIAFAFTAGLIAIVNPCGFAMLPAYLSYFLGIEGRSDTDGDPRSSVMRALVTGGVVSSGFLVVFGIVGGLFTAGLTSIQSRIPWVGVLIGVAMITLGIAMWRGFQLTVALPKLERGGSGRDLRSLFLFGISYAIASLSCAFPTFIAVFGPVDDFDSGLASFGAYAAGMTVVLMTLTVSMALARQSLLQTLRSAMRHVDRAAAGLLIVAGAYTVYFWIIDLTDTDSESQWRSPVLWVEELSDGARNWVRETGGTRVGLLLISVLAAGVGLVLVRPTNQPSNVEAPSSR